MLEEIFASIGKCIDRALGTENGKSSDRVTMSIEEYQRMRYNQRRHNRDDTYYPD